MADGAGAALAATGLGAGVGACVGAAAAVGVTALGAACTGAATGAATAAGVSSPDDGSITKSGSPTLISSPSWEKVSTMRPAIGLLTSTVTYNTVTERTGE